MVGDYLENYTYTELMKSALSHVPVTVDSREGSIIYDALAPACYELANYYMRLRKLLLETFALTSSGEYLDLRVAEQGIKRYAATKALKRGDFSKKDISNELSPISVPTGSKFSTVGKSSPLNYIAIEPYKQDDVIVPGAYVLQCEDEGTIGNSYVGELLPITYMSGLDIATMSTLLVPARDVETDDDLRQRYFWAINNKPFGGNIAQYDSELKAMPGIGEVQIYPVWDGGGTVKCSIVDTEYNAVSSDFLNRIQLEVDPENSVGVQGSGLGIAPIGHVVSIVTPTELIINIEATVILLSGYNITTVQPSVERAVKEYILTLKKSWGHSDDLNRYALSVYSAKLTAAILSVSGIANVTNVLINNRVGDLELKQTATEQQLPKFGAVTLNG